jgi:DNA primase
VDTTPIDRSQPRDRSIALLHDFFTACRIELRGRSGAQARGYLEGRGLPTDAIDRCGLGVVPAERDTKRLLEAGGYTEHEIASSGVLTDHRWPGRVCGGWRDEQGFIRTLWARSLSDDDTAPRFLYLRGASRTGLPAYGFSTVLELPLPERRELVIVEGLLDVHHLRAKGLANVAAIGSARIQPETLAGLTRYGIETVTLVFDNDEPGRDGLVRAIDRTSRLENAPSLRVLDPTALGDSKDPDEFVRQHGIDRFRSLLREADCAIAWRALDYTRDVVPGSDLQERRAALARTGRWLGSLPSRLALEQVDAIRAVSERCGYSAEAVERAFRARFWAAEPSRREREPALHPTRELDHSIDL